MSSMDAPVASLGFQLEFPLGGELNSTRRLFVFVQTNRYAECSGRRAHDWTCRFSDDHGRDFELAPPESVEKGVDDAWIEVGARSFGDDIARFEERHRLSIGSIAGDGIVDVGYGDDARFERDVFTAGRMVARRVELVVVREHNRDDATPRAADRFEQRHPLADV